MVTGRLDRRLPAGHAAALAAVPRRWYVRHLPVLVLLLLGAALRAVAAYAYWPALMFYGDSYSYLHAARVGAPPYDRPFGYPALLRVLSWAGTLAAVPAVQHLLGLGLAVGTYALLLRRGAPRWLATLATVPILFDGYQINIEQQVLSETLFEALLLAGVAVALSARTRRRAALAGVLLAGAAVTRTAGVVAVVLLVGYLAVRSRGWRLPAAAGVAAAVPLLAYASWFQVTHHAFELQGAGGHFLYGRVAPFASCSGLHLDAEQRRLCPTQPLGARPGPNWFDWSPKTPYDALKVPTKQANAIARGFARKVIIAQPLDYLDAVARDTGKYFLPGRSDHPGDESNAVWRFPLRPQAPLVDHALAQYDVQGTYTGGRLDRGAAAFLRDYQSVAYTPGPLLAVALLAGLAGGLRRREGGRRFDAPFAAVTGLGLLVIASATAEFSYRYVLPAVLLLPVAGGLAGARRDRVPVHRGRPAGVETGWSPRRRRLVAVAGAGLAVALVAAPVRANPVFDTWSTFEHAELGPLGPMTGPARSAGGLTGAVVQPFAGGTLTGHPGGTVTIQLRCSRVPALGAGPSVGCARHR